MGSTRVRVALSTWGGVVAVVLVFLFAVRLLGTATAVLAPTLSRLLATTLVSDLPALGIGWLAATLLGNGTIVAAIALSLHAAGLLTAVQLLLLVVGSRLGATGVVLFIGVLDSLRGRAVPAGTTVTVGKSLELGLLASVLTAVVYLPTAALGYLLARLGVVERVAESVPAVAGHGRDLDVPSVFEPVAVSVTEAIGAPAAVVGAVLLVFVALELSDRVLAAVDTTYVRARITTGLESRWRAVTVGFLVTALTTSVAFSLGMVVPLYNRGYLDRREMAPYVLGANVGTLADTLAVAVLLGDPVGSSTVLVVGGVAAAVTLVVLVVIDPVMQTVSLALDVVRASPWYTTAALVGFLAVPLGIVVFG